MATALLLLAPFIVLLLLAAAWDLASYTIPNWIHLALLIAFAVFAVGVHMSVRTVGIHLLVGFAALAFSILLFSFGRLGGGDAKLFTCTALWFGYPDVLQYTLATAIVGGAFGLALLAFRRSPLPTVFATQPWISRLSAPSAGIPYGVALAAGAFVILPYTEIYHAAI